MQSCIGILALQGAYQKHSETLTGLGVKSRLIRSSGELGGCSALIIPGGESTTISLLMQNNNLYKPVQEFARRHPVMGVCAGMIMMAESVDDERVTPLNIMPFRALRNHYGRQVHSFTANIKLDFSSSNDSFPAHFIRAPGIDELSPGIQVLATYNGKAVMIGAGHHVALSFHPELTNDSRIHEYWLSNFSQVLSYANIQ